MKNKTPKREAKRELYKEQVVIVAKYNKTGGSHSDFHVAACEYMELEMLIREEERVSEEMQLREILA